MQFEKWQALGNDYLIIEASALDHELSPTLIRNICNRNFGPGADGIIEVSPPTERGYIARFRIFNPDGSEAEMSGNGTRQACLFLKHSGWTDADTFSVQTLAGELRATILDDFTCKTDIGRALLKSPNYPTGPQDGSGQIDSDGRTWNFQHVTIGNPQCSIRVEADELPNLSIASIGNTIENSSLFPNRTNVSFWAEDGVGRIKARIFERGVGETLSSGTGACGAAISYVLRGGDSPVTVVLDGGELTVEVDESLHVDLTGSAAPIYQGSMSNEWLKSISDSEIDN